MKHYLLGLYEKSMPNSLSLREKLIHAGRAGFDYVELSIDETDEKLSRLKWSEDEIASLYRIQQETGIPIKSICLSGHRKFPLGHPDKEVRQKSMEIMEDAVLFSARLGVRIIQIAGYDVYYEPSTSETRKHFSENLARSVEIAAREGVILAFETMETPFLNTVKKAMDWVEEIRSIYLQVYPDVGNITNAALECGTGACADLMSGQGHIAAIHLKETKPGIYREVPYGSGHVDFDEITSTALTLGVRMFVGEFWYTEQENWEATLYENNRFLRNFLDK